MAKSGRAPKITRMRETEAKVRAIPRDRDNTDDLEEAALIARTKHSRFEHPGKKVRKGSFEGNVSSPQGPNNAVILP